MSLKGIWLVFRAWEEGMVYGHKERVSSNCLFFFPYSFDASSACGNSRIEVKRMEIGGRE